jgi:putative flippase GtrA
MDMKALRRIGWFVVVGCVAAAVHFGTVVLLVETAGAAPLLANVLGWLLAFAVSFTGQSRLTFRSHGTPWRVALPRFFALSLAGFVLNETGYALLLRWTDLPYDLALACVLLAVAVMTYLLGSSWAFRRTPAR